MTPQSSASSQTGTTGTAEKWLRAWRISVSGKRLQINAGETKELVVDFWQVITLSSCTSEHPGNGQ